MEALTHVIEGFSVSLQPHNLLFTFIGVFLVTIVGVLPGLGRGSLDIFANSPICVVLLTASALALAFPIVMPRVSKYFRGGDE